LAGLVESQIESFAFKERKDIMKERIFIRKLDDTANGNHVEMWDERSVFLKQGVMTVRGKGR
jgi:hypothetical protein